MSQTYPIHVTVNGVARSAKVEARTTLAELLREQLNLTGTHLACGHGVCGACTVLVDGESTRACLMFAVQLDGRSVTTVEGLAIDGEMSLLQRCFNQHHALQCGFCSPGMLTTAYAFLQETPSPSAAQVRQAISGNICRCTGYVPIVDAILDASRRLQASTVQANSGGTHGQE
jgi:aerobic-type carbon monoxide dehydrogenase small subunit (CoxS/CutS family)